MRLLRNQFISIRIRTFELLDCQLNMSSAFVKEGDYQPLKEVAPNMASLLIYLKRENGYPVKELHARFSEKHQLEVHEMSDGLGYAINNEQQWQVILD